MAIRIQFDNTEWMFVFEVLNNILGDMTVDEDNLFGKSEAEIMKLRCKLWLADSRDLEDLLK